MKTIHPPQIAQGPQAMNHLDSSFNLPSHNAAHLNKKRVPEIFSTFLAVRYL